MSKLFPRLFSTQAHDTLETTCADLPAIAAAAIRSVEFPADEDERADQLDRLLFLRENLKNTLKAADDFLKTKTGLTAVRRHGQQLERFTATVTDRNSYDYSHDLDWRVTNREIKGQQRDLKDLETEMKEHAGRSYEVDGEEREGARITKTVPVLTVRVKETQPGS